ncbi:MAG TPA: phosphodiesterase [Casimicrobiaceae bacterium]|jgi:3',5'-cyclic AMP phosphodiesterase CpdA|nr:phosphodiesterase [Casimicrobiaceae bacterium]
MLLCQISDLHVKEPGALCYGVVDSAAALRACVDHIVRLRHRPDVVVATGDLTDFGRPDEYLHLRALLAPLPMPVYLMPGNHDDRDALRAAFPDHAYLRATSPHIQYAFDAGPLHVVALDTTIPGESGGALDAPRLDWLEQNLAEARGRPVVILMHHAPFPVGIGHIDSIGLADPEPLAAIVRRHPNVERVLCGHLHRPILARFAGTVASTCPSPAHQVLLEFGPDAPNAFTLEPPAFQLHRWEPAFGLVSHTAFIGRFDGPYPFHDATGALLE